MALSISLHLLLMMATMNGGSRSGPDPPAGQRDSASEPEIASVGPGHSGSMSYNTGTGEDRRKALDAILEYNKTLITLATGTLALSATFIGKELYRGRSVRWLVFSWIALGVSLLFGAVGIGAHISQYAESDIQPRRSQSEYFSLGQLVTLAAGLAMLGYFAIDNSTSPRVNSPLVSTTIAPTGTSTSSTTLSTGSMAPSR